MNIEQATTKSSQTDLGRVLILGLGSSGKAVTSYCAEFLGSRVESIFVAAGEKTSDACAFLESFSSDKLRGELSYAFGDEALQDLSTRFDLCIASPGIPPHHPLYKAGKALSAELIGELEFAWRESDPHSQWVAITGTNGKTTTCALSAYTLEQAGLSAAAVGNIGEVSIETVKSKKTQIHVAEASSYQLYSTSRFLPDCAVLLNITPDHMHWHGSFKAYCEAKYKILRHALSPAETPSPTAPETPNTSPGAFSILDATDELAREKIRELRAAAAHYLPIGSAQGIYGSQADMRTQCGSENAAFIDEEGILTVAYAGVEHKLIHHSELGISGAHNLKNALVAAGVALYFKVDDAHIAAALKDFRPLPHRIEPCGEIAGVSCYNDSKATNVDAAVKALSAFKNKPCIVLLGGQDKDTDLGDLTQAVYEHTQGAICFGQAGPRIHEALKESPAYTPDFTLVLTDHMAQALDEALAHASPGEVILLSPACASFDEFSSFEERGDTFKHLVNQRAQKAQTRTDTAKKEQA